MSNVYYFLTTFNNIRPVEARYDMSKFAPLLSIIFDNAPRTVPETQYTFDGLRGIYDVSSVYYFSSLSTKSDQWEPGIKLKYICTFQGYL